MLWDAEPLADWMSRLPEELWDVALSDLAIPGSHDAMSYCLDISSPLVRSESSSFRLLHTFFYCLTRPAIYRWATTQVNNLAQQLDAGVRYLDLRIARRPHDPSDNIYFKHVIYTSLTVLEMLKEMATWLKAHPKEVVILACRQFEGLSEELHETFIRSIKMIFGSKMCPRNESLLTLRSLWASGYQVLLSYDDQVAEKHPELWPPIPYLWANQRSAEQLLRYLERQKEAGRPEGFFVSGLNLTADRLFITLHPRRSLWTLTVQNAQQLLDWLQEQRPGPDSTSLNIIAGDFVGLVRFCPLVVALNEKLVRPRRETP